MVLLTDDMDLRDTSLEVFLGGNGDYYIELKETRKGELVKLCTRIATSGGIAPLRVKLAVAELYRALAENTPTSQEQCATPAVSNQRELLLDFLNWFDQPIRLITHDELIDEYLKDKSSNSC